MTRAEKAKKIGAILDRLLPQPDIPLGHGDPFTLLVAVFRRAPTPEALARMPEHEILKLIRSCGLAPSKARNLKRLAQAIVDEHSGRVPRDLEALERLPGVGHKSASVVMVQAFGEPAFPIDTHIHRLAARWGLSSGKSVLQTETDLKKLFPREDWGKRHLQLIYFGRQYCPARNHDMSACPICSWAARKRRA